MSPERHNGRNDLVILDQHLAYFMLAPQDTVHPLPIYPAITSPKGHINRSWKANNPCICSSTHWAAPLPCMLHLVRMTDHLGPACRIRCSDTDRCWRLVDIGGIQDDRGVTLPIQIGSDLAGSGAKIVLLTADIIFKLVEYFCSPLSFLLRLALRPFPFSVPNALTEPVESSSTMHISSAILAAVLSASSLVASAPTDRSSATDLLLSLNEKATSALEKGDVSPNGRSGSKKCTIFNAAVRRDW